jgi:predicted acylesterase/phospholipase RssA
MDNFRKNVLPKWGVDWNKIRAGTRLGTFNLFNFSKKRLEVTPNSQMDEDKLIASVSLPMWFPPVVLNGDKYIDAVYITDANVQEAINRGADELWAIWTVSLRDEWRPGFVAQYFHIIETTADTNFFTMLDRIKTNNDEIAAGRKGEFGRNITIHLIQAEVPVHYLFNYSRDQMAQAVNQGVQAARDFCKQLGMPLQSPPTPQPGPRRRRRACSSPKTCAASSARGRTSSRASTPARRRRPSSTCTSRFARKTWTSSSRTRSTSRRSPAPWTRRFSAAR